MRPSSCARSLARRPNVGAFIEQIRGREVESVFTPPGSSRHLSPAPLSKILFDRGYVRCFFPQTGFARPLLNKVMVYEQLGQLGSCCCCTARDSQLHAPCDGVDPLQVALPCRLLKSSIMIGSRKPRIFPTKCVSQQKEQHPSRSSSSDRVRFVPLCCGSRKPKPATLELGRRLETQVSLLQGSEGLQ